MKQLIVIFKNGNSLKYNCQTHQEVENVKQNFGNPQQVWQVWENTDKNLTMYTGKEFFNH